MKCFDPFRLDAENQCLWRGQTRVPLMPKPFAVLVYLVEHAGRLITQDELLKSLWPDTHVQPEVLRKHIKEVRRALGDIASTPQFIETQPKRGYRFTAPVRDQTASTPALANTSAPTLVGRQTVFAALNDRFRRALAGERQLVFVTGEAGIGKTSVVQAFESAVSSVEPVRVAWGQAVEGFGGKEPYYPLLEALARLGQGPDRRLIVDALAASAPTWLIQLPSLVLPEDRAALRREAVGATTQRMVRELCDALETITQTIALVLVLEDLHWVDHSTLDALSAIARRRERARLLIIGTYRPVNVILGDSPFKSLRRDLCMHGLAHELALEPLTAADIGRYVASSFSPNELPPGIERVLHSHSGGNPLFMSATLDHLVRRGVLKRDGSCWRLTLPLDQIEPDVPETLRHILELQFEQLTDLEGRVLMCASVAGERFSSWHVATMLAADGTDADTVCEALVTRGQFLRSAGESDPSNGLPTAAFEFKHALYRDALYRRLPAAIRTTYHRRLAEGLDPLRATGHEDLAGEVAAHYEAARVFDRAVTSTMVAAEIALRRYAHSEALALLHHASKLNQRTQDGATGRRLAELLQRIGDVHYARGEMVLATDAYERAAAAASDAQLWAAAAQALIRSARSGVFVDVRRALDACERAASVAVDGEMPAVAVRARLVRLCWDLLHRGWSRDRAAAAAAAFHTLVQSPADLTPADHILYANVQVFRSEYWDACTRADSAFNQLQVTDTLWEHLGALAAKGGALSLLGRGADAYRTLTTGLEMARRNDNAPWLDILTGLLASLHLHVGDFAGARAIASERLSAPLDDRGTAAQMHLLVVSGGAELGLGQIQEAVARFSAVRTAPFGDQPVIQWYWRLTAQLGLAEAAIASGDLTAAWDHVSQLTNAVADLDETMLVALAWECRARVALAAKQPDAADESIGNALQTLERCEVPAAAWRVQATAAAIRRRARPSQADAHLHRARTILASLAQSLEGHERLQQSLLAVPAVRTIVHGSQSAAAGPKMRLSPRSRS